MVRLAFLLVAGFAFLESCGGSESTAPAPVASVSVSASATSLKAGKTLLLVAQTKDASGNVLSGRTIAWSSSNTGSATVAADGTVTAVSAGIAVITATSEGKSFDFQLTITRASLATIVVQLPQSQLPVGQTLQAVTTLTDSTGRAVTDAVLSWSSSDVSVATVNGTGAITAVNPGTARIDARAEGILGSATVTVIPAPVASVAVTLTPSSVIVGQPSLATAVTRDGLGNTLSGRAIAWSSSDSSTASISSSGAITTKAVGSVTITASSEGKSGSAQLTVTGPAPVCATTLTMALGEIRTLSAGEKSSFCLSASGSADEYVVIPFNNASVAASTITIQLNGTNTLAPSATAVSGNLVSASGLLSDLQANSGLRQSESTFRQREYSDLKPVLSSYRAFNRQSSAKGISYITGIPATPAVGDVFPLNANLTGNTCTAAKDLHPSRVIALFPHVIVMADTLAPAGGYTSAEMTAFGQAFESTGYPLDSINFGGPTDIDSNGRVVVFFTQGVNVIPGPAGSVVGGLTASRDLFPVSVCAASNEGEMFYIPVPDPGRVINGNYSNKSFLSNLVLATLVHEFQHLINAGRRIYVNGASSFEEVWLNEGLSHIAEELLYYQVSGNAPRNNINLATLQSSQAQLDAVNTYQIQNLARLRLFMTAEESNSPYAQNDILETRGAIWQLLRYAADRKGGVERTTWFGLVNSVSAGQANFNSNLGDIVTLTRDWTVAQFADDIGFALNARYTNPSWNFRSVLPAINSGSFPLFTRTLTGSPVDVTLRGGAASYVRFQVVPGAVSQISTTSSSQPLPASVDVTIMEDEMRYRVLIGALCVFTVFAAGACRPAATPAPVAAAGKDSLTGIVSVTGTEFDKRLVLRTQSSVVALHSGAADSAALMRLGGVEILVAGDMLGQSSISVTSFVALRVDGRPVVDGVLKRSGGKTILSTATGDRSIGNPPATFNNLIGARVWIGGPLDTGPNNYGVIVPPNS